MAELEFFFDVGSPYSYLAATQLEALGLRTGATVRWRPFLLGAVFKATSNHMPAAVQAKAMWMLSDLRNWANHYGVPFTFSSRFPLNTLLPQRFLSAAVLDKGEQGIAPLALALFEAYWVHDRDISNPQVAGAVADEVGLDGNTLLALASQAPAKDALRATTDEAVARGAFGAPSFFVGERLFWGNDRLDFVEAALKG